MDKIPLVSVVIPVRNREDEIAPCLDAIMAQDYPTYETIVVDNDSSDKTREVVSQYPVKLIVETKPGAYAARNAGISHAKGKIIAFTDSDCLVDKTWLTNLVSGYTDENVGGVGGDVLPYRMNGFVAEFLTMSPQEIFQSSKRGKIVKPSNCFLCGAIGSGNMSFRKEILIALNGFSEDLPACGDYEFSWRVQRAGYNLVFEPRARVHHRARKTVSQLIHLFYTRGKSEPMLLKKQPGDFSFVEVRPYVLPSRRLRCRLPIQSLVTLDFINLGVLALILALIYYPSAYLAFILYVAAVWKTWRGAKRVGITGGTISLLVSPVLHLVRYYSTVAGRIVGGATCGILSL